MQDSNFFVLEVGRGSGVLELSLEITEVLASTSMVQGVGSLRVLGRCSRWKVVIPCSWVGNFYSLLRNFGCRMYHLATMHTVLHTDEQSTL